jgi:hypothetical protein
MGSSHSIRRTQAEAQEGEQGEAVDEAWSEEEDSMRLSRRSAV